MIITDQKTYQAKMRKFILLCSILMITNTLSFAQYKNWGVGLRLGDPSGITAKKYLTNKRALELIFGRSGAWGYNYKNAFYRFDQFDERYYDYRWHQLRSALSFQVHYLIHQPIKSNDFKGLDWYYGFGGQLRAFTIDYEYRYYYAPDKRNGEIRYDKVTDVDIGLDGTIGLEYSWREVPISIFTDLNLFMEIADSPFLFFLQGGVGARYYF